MSLIIATGSNLGNKIENLSEARQRLEAVFALIAQSRVYQSAAVGHVDQPAFYNQVLEFALPTMTPKECLARILEIEREMGRVRDFKWGPRKIDIDIVFWGHQRIAEEDLCIPHPYWRERSFVVRPLSELPFASVLAPLPDDFETEAKPVE